MTPLLAIAAASLRRVLRDRTALFFILVLPVVLMVIVGAVASGGQDFRIGVVERDTSAAAGALVKELADTPGLDVSRYRDAASLEISVARSDLDAGVVIPAGFGSAIRTGKPVVLQLMAEQANSTQQAAALRVRSVVASEGARVQAALFASRYGGSYAENEARARSLQIRTAAVGVVPETVKTTAATLPAGYEYSAPTELVLFVFLTAVASGATIVETRRLGMFERMSSAPVAPGTIILGSALTYVSIALVQSIILVAVGSLVFGVSWGDPLGAGALLLLWSLVGGSAGMVAGTLFRTPEQASAIGPVVGIALAMLGGCMWPLSIVSPTMREIGHVTPQAWAVDAWTALLARHATLTGIGGELGVLALFATLFFALSTIRLRASVSGSPFRRHASTRAVRP